MGRLSSDGTDAVLLAKLKLILEKTLVKQPGSIRRHASSVSPLGASDQYASFVAALDPECPVSRKCVQVLARETMARANGKTSALKAAYASARRAEEAARPSGQSSSSSSRAWMGQQSSYTLSSRPLTGTYRSRDADEISQYDAILAEAQRRVTSPLPGASGLDANVPDNEDSRPRTFGSPPSENLDDILTQLNDHRIISRATTTTSTGRDPRFAYVDPRDVTTRPPASRRVLRRPEDSMFRTRATETLEDLSAEEREEAEGMSLSRRQHFRESRAAAVERELLEYRQWRQGESADRIEGDQWGSSGSDAMRAFEAGTSSAAETRRRIVDRLAARRRDREAQRSFNNDLWYDRGGIGGEDSESEDELAIPTRGRSAPRLLDSFATSNPSSLGLLTTTGLPIMTGGDFQDLSSAEPPNTIDVNAQSAVPGSVTASNEGSEPQRQSSLHRNFSIRRSGFHASPTRSTPHVSSDAETVAPHPVSIHPNNPEAPSRFSTASLANDVVSAARSSEFSAHARNARAADRAAREGGE